MLYIPEKQALFIHIPKTGGDYVTQFLEGSKIPTRRPDMKGSGGKHCPDWMVRENVRFTFAFVREPVAWFKSYYSFITRYYISKYGDYPVFEEGKWHPQRRFEKYDYSTFDKFVQSVYSDEPACYTRLIECFTGPEDARKISFIGKQEKLNDDLGDVLELLGYSIEEKRARKGDRRINASSSESVVASEETIQLIETQEKAFYRRFGYQPKTL